MQRRETKLLWAVPPDDKLNKPIAKIADAVEEDEYVVSYLIR